MRLTGRELDRLTIFTLSEFARRRRSRGRRLNAPEAAAVVVDEILEWAWDGLPLSEVIDRARSVLGRDDVMEGVPEIVGRIEVDALFPSGTTLVVVDYPFGPPPEGAEVAAPGAVVSEAGRIAVNPGADPTGVVVENTADVPIEVTSHFHFFEVNRRLSFDRRLGFGMRLDVPAGTSVRWEPGERKEIDLIPITGTRQAWGFGGLVDGPLDVADAAAILEEAIRRGYHHEEEAGAG
jgi:urease subunit gamma/beta